MMIRLNPSWTDSDPSCVLGCLVEFLDEQASCICTVSRESDLSILCVSAEPNAGDTTLILILAGMCICRSLLYDAGNSRPVCVGETFTCPDENSRKRQLRSAITILPDIDLPCSQGYVA